jgi:hypothetical protein
MWGMTLTKSNPLNFFWNRPWIPLWVVSRVLFFASMIVMEDRNHQKLTPNSFCKWDCAWYLSIIENGYQSAPNLTGHVGAANWAFFPVFPYLIYFLDYLTGLDSITTALVTNNILFYFSLQLIYKYLYAKSTKRIATTSIFLMAFSPLNVNINSIYTESLFFFEIALLVTLLNQKRWISAGLIISLMGGTKVIGMLFIISLIVAYFSLGNANIRANKQKIMAAIAISPIGIIIFMSILFQKVHDPLAFIHIQKAWGVATINFFGWVYKVFSSDSITLYIYLILFLVTSISVLYFFQKKNVS